MGHRALVYISSPSARQSACPHTCQGSRPSVKVPTSPPRPREVARIQPAKARHGQPAQEPDAADSGGGVRHELETARGHKLSVAGDSCGGVGNETESVSLVQHLNTCRRTRMRCGLVGRQGENGDGDRLQVEEKCDLSACNGEAQWRTALSKVPVKSESLISRVRMCATHRLEEGGCEERVVADEAAHVPYDAAPVARRRHKLRVVAPHLPPPMPAHAHALERRPSTISTWTISSSVSSSRTFAHRQSRHGQSRQSRHGQSRQFRHGQSRVPYLHHARRRPWRPNKKTHP